LRAALLALLMLAGEALLAPNSSASTYVVYIPLDDPIYQELDTLNGLGFLDDYLAEIKPISRIEAARLALEAQRNMAASGENNPLAAALADRLALELADEVNWVKTETEDSLPSMLHPLGRLEAAYIYSSGGVHFWNTGGTGANISLKASEGTPLLPNNDGIATGAGSNEVLRWSGWGGLAGFLTGYGEVEASGPFTRSLSGNSRVLPLGAEAVLGLGNHALSFGQEEMWWGTGNFAPLSQGDNATPFVALRWQNIHPTLLPGFLRYLGQFRYQVFFGQLDGDRYNAHPWIDGQIVSFKPLPTFEFGFTHAIDFGGRYNDHYSFSGFLGRATGFHTGSIQSGNTNSRGGIYLKFYFPRLRNLQVYQEILGEDNLTNEIPGVGSFLPFKAISYQGGFYLPRLTRDGRTDLRLEYAILDPNYSIHETSLYWTNDEALMSDALGPNATEVDLALGRWIGNPKSPMKLVLDLFYTEQAPGYDGNKPYPTSIYGPNLTKQRSGGFALDFNALPLTLLMREALAAAHMRVAVEYVHAPNYTRGVDSWRALLMFSGSLSMDKFRWTPPLLGGIFGRP
jgi:capsule assembly protein Wzi